MSEQDKKIDDGGPAFPRTAANPDWGNGTEPFEGISVRMYLAAKAMQGMIASASGDGLGMLTNGKAGMDFHRTNCIEALQWADALIAASKETP